VWFAGIPVYITLGRWARNAITPHLWFLPARLVYWLEVPIGLLFWLSLIALTIRLARRRIERHLRTGLLAAGVPVCMHCGYDLRGQTEARCPECGRAFDPHLLHCGQDASTIPPQG